MWTLWYCGSQRGYQISYSQLFGYVRVGVWVCNGCNVVSRCDVVWFCVVYVVWCVVRGGGGVV